MLASESSLKNQIRTKGSFIFYGQKSSGKTSFIKKMFHETSTKHIDVNCTLVDQKRNFLKLFNVQINRFLRNNDYGHIKLSYPCHFEAWISELKSVSFNQPGLSELLDGMYVFMDDIEELRLNQFFLPNFYYACQKQFEFRFSFIFCGTNFSKKEYLLQQPFRTMICFCQPKPTKIYNDIVYSTINTIIKHKYSDKQYRKKVDENEIEKTTHTLALQVIAAFENIQYNLQKIGIIVKEITINVCEKLGDTPLKSLMKIIHSDELKQLVHKIQNYGDLNDYDIRRKIFEEDDKQRHDTIDNKLEYYANLILTSIHLADYYNQKEDKRRFQDYKTKSSIKCRQMKKENFKIGKHSLNRIIAISESLQSQAKENDKQQILEHHSLDYYTQFEYLKSIDKLKMLNKNGNKLMGFVKEEEAKYFMKKNQLYYQQFMG